MFSPALTAIIGWLTFSSFIANALADCCYSTPCGQYFPVNYCTSTDPVDDYTCCGVGPCNIFCCNCDNGCIPFDHCPSDNKRDVAWTDIPAASTLASSNATCSPTDSTDDCVLTKFEILDTNNDGKVSILELIAGWALVWVTTVSADFDVVDTAESVIFLVEKFVKYDTNGDGFLTLAECSQQLA